MTYYCKRLNASILILISLWFNLIFVNKSLASSPNDIVESNITRSKVTISWLTEVSERGQVNYGATPSLGSTVYDERGETFEGRTHYVTIEGLEPNTLYYYDIVSGGITYDNGGAHFTVTTGAILSPSADSDIAYGQVFLSDGVTPAQDAIVYIRLKDNDGLGTQGESQMRSYLVGTNGYWYLDLKNVRTEALNSYFDYSNTGDNLVLSARGPNGEISSQLVDTSQDTPSPSMTLRINAPPVLEWTAESGYESDGLDPEVGYGSTEFIFKIRYIDSNGDAPSVYKVYIDKNGDGDYTDPGEANDMTASGTDYAAGIAYIYATTIPYSEGSQNVSYYFSFSDGFEFATGNIIQAISQATAINKPDIFQTLGFVIDRTNWQLLNIQPSSQHILDSSNKIRITNNGDGVQTYSLRITNEGNSWSSSSSKDGASLNTFVLSGLFTGDSQAGIDSTYFNEVGSDDVIVTGNADRASSTRFGSTRTLENGSQIPAGQSRALWLEFKAPTKDTIGQTQSIEFTINAEVP